MLSLLTTRFYRFAYRSDGLGTWVSICGKTELCIHDNRLIIMYDDALWRNYKLHELDIAIPAAVGATRGRVPLEFIRYFAPAIAHTLMYRLGSLAAHLRALGLQDLMQAIVHYYLW